MIAIDLTGKNALITGGTRGIGRAISLTLAGAGATIAAVFRSDHETADQTLADLIALGPNTAHFAIQADISVEAQAIEAVRTAEERFGGALDFLILDAAAGAGGPLAGMKTEEWKRPFEVNVHGAFYMARAAVPLLRPGGSILFISSGAAHDPLDGLCAYGASKAAVNHMAAVLAQEVGPAGVRVNIVSPGHTDKSGLDPNAHPDHYSAGERSIVGTTALRRIGTAQDVANAVLFFVSDLSSFVTGQWIRVNGGRI